MLRTEDRGTGAGTRPYAPIRSERSRGTGNCWPSSRTIASCSPRPGRGCKRERIECTRGGVGRQAGGGGSGAVSSTDARSSSPCRRSNHACFARADARASQPKPPTPLQTPFSVSFKRSVATSVGRRTPLFPALKRCHTMPVNLSLHQEHQNERMPSALTGLPVSPWLRSAATARAGIRLWPGSIPAGDPARHAPEAAGRRKHHQTRRPGDEPNTKDLGMARGLISQDRMALSS